jgi:class 3 adenylate cyclase
MLNEYLNAMAEIAIDYGGTVDKFIGDGIMVFFGDPSTRGAAEDALCCVRMALEMRRSLKPLRRKWQRDGIFSELHIRIGINTGYCAVGNFGSENRMDYTAVGGTVNIASRLETSASRDGISISGHTYQLISRHIKCIEKEPVMAKGIRRPIENYSVVTERQDSKFCIVEQDIKGLHISMNPVLVDIHKARTILKEVEASIARIEQNQIESTKRINRLG